MEAIYQEQSGNGIEITRKDIQASIAKAAELRALHVALMQGNSPANLGRPSASPVSRHAPNLSALDYPVFTPSYEGHEPLTEYHQTLSQNCGRKYAENWADYAFDLGNINETILSDYTTENASSRNELQSEFSQGHIRLAGDQNFISSFTLGASPGPDYSKSRRTSLGDIKSVSSCSQCKHVAISKNNDFDSLTKNSKKSNTVIPLTDSHSSLHVLSGNKGLSLSWLFPRGLKKKTKNENSLPIRSKPEETSQMLNDFGILYVEKLKNALMEANETRDAALNEVKEMKSSLGEVSQKLEYIESYCEELKNTLRQVKNTQLEKITNFTKSRKYGYSENSMPVSEEVMVEGFLQIVSEARLSVKHFCKTLLKQQMEDSDHTLKDNMNSLLQPYKLSLNSKYSKAVCYHLEAFVNRSLYQDFENSVFQKNGTPKLLDPHQERQAQFQLFVSLRNLSWKEVLGKGTTSYSDEFSKFCDEKMSGIGGMLGWTRPWPEQLLQAFFVAAKCIWLVHLLAFSFYPPLSIFRVDKNRLFEGRYMEEMFADKQRPQGPSRVKIMVMPGFYVHDEVLRCKVLCRYKSFV